MLHNEALKAAIDRCTDKKMVIFDSQARPGQFTLRLIDLISKEFRGLTAIVVHESVQIPAEVLLEYPSLTIFKITNDTYRQLHRYYIDVLWGTLAPEDLSLIIGIDDKFDFILGSY